MVTTFTDKAAQELRDRIQKKVPDVNVEMMQVSTIHSFCLKILQKYNSPVNMPAGISILNDREQLLFIFSHSEELGLNPHEDDPYGFFSNVQRTFNLATEELVEPSSLESWCQLNLANCSAKDASLWKDRSLLVLAYERYLKLLQSKGLLDFALLQRNALNLIQNNPIVLADVKKQYSEILIDEYQDTDAAQDRILCLLAGDGKHFTAVGDDDQSIYRFRGATVRNILTFKERFPGSKVIKLEQNFRSKKPIVQNSQQVIVNNPARIPKELTSVRGIGSDVLVVYKQTFAEEAKASIDLLRRLLSAGKIAHYGDIVVLLRSVKYAPPYVAALQQANMPFDVIGDANFFKRREISRLCDLLLFLNISGQWGDRYLHNPLLDFSPETNIALEKNKENLMKIATRDDLQSIGVMNKNDQCRLLDLITLKCQVQGGNHSSILNIFYQLLRCTGCACRFEQEGNLTPLINLGLMSQIISAWDEYGGTYRFNAFLEYLKLLKQGGVDTVTLPPKDSIQIMSIHQAKGLEFPVVIMGSVVNGRLPICSHPVYFDIPYDLRASGWPEVDDPHLVDERRLFYVAATRARDLLIIGTADAETKCGTGPSIFLKEMFGENLKAYADFTKAYVEEVESKPHSNTIRTRHSFSQLSYFLQCPLRYKYAMIYDFHIPWLDAIGFGENVHRVLEAIHNHYLEGQMPTDDEIPSIVADRWVPRDPTKLDEEREFMDAAVKQIHRYLREHGSTLSSVIKAETNFSFDLDGQIIIGKIDLIKREQRNSIELVDFKTSKMPIKDFRDEGIDLQLDLYALGAERALGLNIVKTTAHFLGDGKLFTNAWSSDRRANALLKIEDMLNRIDKGEYSPNLSYCAYCQEFRAICPYAMV